MRKMWEGRVGWEMQTRLLEDKMPKLQRIINLSLEEANLKSTQSSTHRILGSSQNCSSPQAWLCPRHAGLFFFLRLIIHCGNSP